MPTFPTRSLRRTGLAALLGLLLLLAACSDPGAAGVPTPDGPVQALDPRPAFPPAAGAARPIPQPEALRPGGAAAGLATLAHANERLELSLLVIGATREDPAMAAWQALLDQIGAPYETLVATEEELTPGRLVAADGTGRFQAILLATSNLSYAAEDGSWRSAFTEAEWELLFRYEREHHVRQVAFYAFPGTLPESYGVEPVGEGGAVPEGYVLRATPAGEAIFDELADGARIPVRDVWAYPSRLVEGGGAEPLLVDGEGHVLAVASVAEDGRERVALLFDQAAWGRTLLLHSQLLGPSLVRWATRGVHLGERRLHLGADIDDWFVATDLWDTEQERNVGDGFELSAADAFSFAEQQADLRAKHPHAAGFTWTMAFNGVGADPSAACAPQGAPGITLSDATMCLADDFWWINHTWSHAYMDRNPPHYDIAYEEILAQIDQNDSVAAAFGFGANHAEASLVTGDVSGLGWYSPNGPDTGPKFDHGLMDSNPDLLRALADTGRRYLASNMSTASHEPDCGGCGIVHPMNDDVLLVPRWPTNVFASVTTPEAVEQAYNAVYGPGGSEPYFERDLSYAEVIDFDTDTALGHVLSGSPYPHYFHIANAYAYAPGRSLLTDWADALLAKVGGYVDLPVRTLPWDELGAYVEERTSFAAAGASGVWDRAAGTLTITAEAGGTVFLTGASLGEDERYGHLLVSKRHLRPGESVTIPDAPGDPPPDPVRYDLVVEVVGEGAVTGDGTYPAGEVATLEARPADGWRFDGWSGALEGDANPARLTMTGDLSVTAVFEEEAPPAGRAAQTIALDTVGDGLGLIVATPIGLACGGPCSAEIEGGAAVTLVAVPLFDSVFAGWNGACEGTGACTVVLDEDLRVHARFAARDPLPGTAPPGRPPRLRQLVRNPP